MLPDKRIKTACLSTLSLSLTPDNLLTLARPYLLPFE